MVPNLVGCSKAGGERLLARLGISFNVEPSGAGLNDDGAITGQQPGPGNVVRIGRSNVVLRERCLPAPCPSPAPGLEIYDPCTCAAR